MKTKGMAHQLEYLNVSGGRPYFAQFSEQGTGKTWSLLAEAEALHAAGKIDTAIVLAPNGVHSNWVLREIPTHLETPAIARAWRSGMSKGAFTRMAGALLKKPERMASDRPLRVLAMNVESIITPKALDFAMTFMESGRTMIILDESTRIKNPNSARWKAAMEMRPLAEYARIGSGRPNPQSPLDFFGQMQFLRKGLLGTSSYRAFVAEYAELVDMNNDFATKKLLQKNPRMAFAQIVAKDEETGDPRYKNLDRLRALIVPHRYRVLKKDCLDLPPKVYKQRYFELAPEQRRAYALMDKERRIVLDSQEVPVKRLGAMTKLQQITSGFVMLDGEVLRPPQLEANPRLEALLELVAENPEPVIVWARFREELSVISAALRAVGRRVVEYHGGVKTKDREASVDDFQNGLADCFVGQPQAGGIGLTLTAATWTVYYSNDFNLETRLQSEDRNNRFGSTGEHTLYYDLVARNTLDEAITKSLQRKERLSGLLLEDAGLMAAALGVADEVEERIRLPTPAAARSAEEEFFASISSFNHLLSGDNFGDGA